MALELSLQLVEPTQTIISTNESSRYIDIVHCPEYTDDLNALISLELVHEIHTSERKSFRGCRRRWDWLYRQHYYPRVTAKPLEFGVAYHVGMETFYRPETWKLPVDIKVERAIQEFTQECEKQKAEAIKVGLFNDFEELENDYDERIQLGTGMIRYHAQYVHPKEDLARELIPVKVEIEFMVPIPNPETGEECIYCKCDECYDKWLAHFFPVGQSEWPQWYINNKWAFSKGIPVVYGGRLDALFIDKYGNYWVVDWKTAAQMREDKEFLLLDDQIGSYVWALRKLGLNVAGFIYHEMFKGFPNLPKQNKTRREGRIFSVDKTQATTYKIYLQTVSREDTEAWSDGKYDDMLNYLQAEGRKFYDRRQIPKTEAEVNSIEYNIGLEALDMLDKQIRLYPSANRFGCGFCAYREPCIAKNNKDDFEYTLDTVYTRKEHYFKEMRQSTDTLVE